jgi:uncharacterized protein
MTKKINVEVAYARPDRQILLVVSMEQGASVLQAIEASGLLQQCADIDLAKNKVGIFGKLVRLDAVLEDKDRVEIYRPLLLDPKEVRRRRAARNKT